MHWNSLAAPLSIAALVLSAALTSTVSTDAAGPMQQKPAAGHPDMPTSGLATPEELKKNFVNMSFSKPLGRPELAFTFLAPTSWKEAAVTVSKEELAHDNDHFVTLAEMTPADESIRIAVAYCRVPATADVEKLARQFIAGSGLVVVHAQKGEFNGGPAFDTLVRNTEFTVRMTFSRQGDKVYLVSGSAPTAQFRANARTFGVAAVSFQKR